jgi:hypothetical protein
MSTEKVIENYIQLIETEHFSKYEKDFAHKIQMGLVEGYQQHDTEPKMVSNVEAIINKVNEFSASVNRFHISTKGIFIHGNKSQVEFEYSDGSKTQRELGDLIFIISIIYNNRKYFEKFTITQFKKFKENLRWDLNKKDKNGKYPDKEQLYLLARFPTFKGVKGSIIPMKEYNLTNCSSCLGSYGLLYNPGDFAFASAKIVEALLRNNKSIGIKRILSVADFCKPLMLDPNSLFCFKDAEELFYLWCKLYKHHLRSLFFLYPIFQNSYLPVIGNSISSSNVHEFSEKYLRALIGELTFANEFPYNQPAFQFLKGLMTELKKKGQKEDKILKFVDSFYRYDYIGRQGERGGQQGEGGGQREGGEEGFDSDGGGIGIIHTMINLGEGE